MHSVIWDWNGTLLNDLDFCVSTINILLKKRDLPLLNHQYYKEVFSFPVKDYYQNIGFNFEKEDFSIPAREFIDLYNNGVKNCALHNSAIEVLNYFKNMGLQQFVLSAMKQNMLEITLKQQNIFHFFKAVAGLNDHYGNSKIERGLQLISDFNIEKSGAWIIGDTIIDYEVAENLGIQCILIADGHKSVERLQKTGGKVIGGLQQLMEVDFMGI
jgi:phosphoglycolate phosphatase